MEVIDLCDEEEDDAAVQSDIAPNGQPSDNNIEIDTKPVIKPKVPPIRVRDLASLQDAPRVISSGGPLQTQVNRQHIAQQNRQLLTQQAKARANELRVNRIQTIRPQNIEAVQFIRNPTTNQMQRIIIKSPNQQLPRPSTAVATTPGQVTFLRPAAPTQMVRPYFGPSTSTNIPQPSTLATATTTPGTTSVLFLRPIAPVRTHNGTILRANNVHTSKSGLPAPRPVYILRPPAQVQAPMLRQNNGISPNSKAIHTYKDRPNADLMRRIAFLRITAEYMTKSLGMQISFGEEETLQTLIAQFQAAKKRKLTERK